MSGENYKEILDLLKQLQDWQYEAVKLERAIEAVPAQIAELEHEIEAQADALKRAEEELQAEKKNNLRLEGELSATQTKLSHYEEQIFKVKTNEQLWALQKEIEFTKNKVSDLETMLIESMEALDKAANEVEEGKTNLSRLTEENTKKIAELQRRSEEMMEEQLRIAEGQTALRQRIPREQLELYDRIITAKGDVAIALARDETCQVCHVRVLPQTFILVRHHKGIFQCENCRRILYYEEEPALENPAELS
jgi:predicted  nucleic acid-binding Zn-ribbon protein